MSEQTNTPQPAEPIVAEKSLQVFHLERELSAAQKRIEDLTDALYLVLPFMEVAECDPLYNQTKAAQVTKIVRAALKEKS